MGKVVFTAVAFVDPNVRIGLCGSLEELGKWDVRRCICLCPQQPIQSFYIPTCFTAVVDLKDLHISEVGPDHFEVAPTSNDLLVRFKFIKWFDTKVVRAVTTSTPSDVSSDDDYDDDRGSGVDSEAESGCLLMALREKKQAKFMFPLPKRSNISHRKFGQPVFTREELRLQFLEDADLRPCEQKERVQWEGDGPHHDRILSFQAANDELQSHTFSGANVYKDYLTGELYYILPCYDYLESNTGGVEQLTEYARTTRYYMKVKNTRSIHFHEVLKGIYVGTCPRDEEHIKLLAKKYAVGIVYNLQTLADIRDNWISQLDPPQLRTIGALQATYKKYGVSLVHLPTEDMSTEAKASLMAQTGCLLACALVAKPDRAIYIHCNAGVGRAVATITSLLRFGLGLSEIHSVTLVKLRRTTAYIDLTALRQGYKDFTQKYQRSLDFLPLVNV